MTLTNDVLTTGESLSEEKIKSYREKGFVHIPAVISKEEASRYYDAALNASTTMENYAKGYAEKVFTQLVNVWRVDPVIKELTLHPNVAAVAERLAGVDLRIWHDHTLIKQPHNQKPTEFHQDQPYWPHNDPIGRHCLSAWVALCDVPVEKGCMTFIDGSHRHSGLRAQDLTDAKDLLSLSPDLAYHERTTIPLRAGDCTFHNSWTAHMATPNFTDDPRVAHIIIYMDADTTWDGRGHVVLETQHYKVGDVLAGDMFPEV